MGTMFWGEGAHGGVTVRVVITVGETNITVGTLVDAVEKRWFVTVVGAWWGGFAVQGGQIQPPQVTPEIHGPQSGSTKSGAGGVDPPLTAAALDRSLPNLIGADGARIFGICWVNKCRGCACKQEENKETSRMESGRKGKESPFN